MQANPALLHEFFLRAARMWPTQVALELPPHGNRERQTYTYTQLLDIANGLRGALTEWVAAESVVAIALPRTSEYLYASQLAVLMSGAAYTCIDPVFPDEQLRHILADANAVAVLTDAAGAERIRRSGFDATVDFAVDAPVGATRIVVAAEVASSANASPAPSWLRPDSLAYLIYTSGTTGRPKGVMIEHASIANLVASDLEAFALQPADRVAQGSSPSYDSSIEETWLAWASGAALVVVSDEVLRLGPDLVGWLRDERISVLCPPPTLLRAMRCENPQTALPRLKLLYVGGEALPTDLADRWAPGRRMVNGYGPTECSVTSLRAEVTAGQGIAIGRPITGLHAWVLDESMNVVATGVQGELCIGGIALARGYRHMPTLTDQRFPHHPEFGRIYRTGDLVDCDVDGVFHYHGRIDSQVKLRGYRVELAAIEARLAECTGVRAAACHVQQDGAIQTLVAFVVAESADAPPTFRTLEEQLRLVLPAYMVPRRWGIIETLPTTIGGKVDRKRLPKIASGLGGAGGVDESDREVIAAATPFEARVVAAFHAVLSPQHPISVDDDFFGPLSGDSLTAAMVISLLRDDPLTESVTVRDLYETKSAQQLAQRLAAREVAPATAEGAQRSRPREVGHPRLATAAQGLWLMCGVLLMSLTTYAVGFVALPMLVDQLGVVWLVMLSPLIYLGGLLLYTLATAVLLILLKRLLIGRYAPTSAPVWGSFFVRHWMVQQTARLIPWRSLEGTVFLQQILRALGARVGERVVIHRGVGLADGGWDLLDIGDDVTLGQDAALRLSELRGGQIEFGPISLASGATLATRAGMDPNSSMGAGACLTALSSLAGGVRVPDGECWSGVPARPIGRTDAPPPRSSDGKVLTPLQFSVALVVARAALLVALALPVELLVIAAAWIYVGDVAQLFGWMNMVEVTPDALVFVAVTAVLAVPVMLTMKALLIRALGRVSSGVVSCREVAYLRVLLKLELLQSAGDWLSGTLLWPLWLRAAGMRIGRGCEISSLIDVIPELVEIGDESFFADGVYLGGAHLQHGTATLALVRLGKNTFLGNHAVIPAGQVLPDGLLLGVGTVADGRIMQSGSGWFGHPAFALARREVVEMDRRLTHEPSWVRYLNRLMWEGARMLLVILPAVATLLWIEMVLAAEAASGELVFLFVTLPLLNLAWLMLFPTVILVMKWLLLGRVKPGQHGLWSCWCSRWDFHYVMWNVYGRATLAALEGTLFLTVYLRMMGMRIGRDVVLGGGFAQVVDPDMLTFEDNATVNAPLFQAHTFEDRVLKIDRVRIRQGASVGSRTVMLYGADIGEHTQVAAESVVMKRERLMPDRCYAGCPTQPTQPVAR